MNKALLAVTAVLGLIALALLGYLLLYQSSVPVPIVIENSPKDEAPSYTSSEHGIAFDYSPGYYLKERDVGSSERPQLSLLLVEDTAENRDVVEGRSTEGRDGPISIVIDVYPNPDKLPAEDWVHADTNWTVRTSDAAPIGRGQITGVTYSWSGLYEGKSVVITEGSRAYVFSVTWLEPDDPILTEFDRVLSTVQLAP
ncbi:MAG: hypothetical protein QOE22_191 [Candidatus Parcubacteria bacterium]|nr:hypothetical protein [Candidatus Parcubacteria bacterium]